MKFIILVLLDIIQSQCEKRKIRRNIKSLQENELQKLVSAIRNISSQPHPNALDRLTRLHLDNSREVHNAPVFLPWHRFFLNEFEKELAKVDPEVTIPYWDWALDSQAPERSEILTDKYFGGNGQGPDRCVTGPFSMENSYRVYYSANSEGSRCLKRNYNQGETLSPFSVPERLDELMKLGSFSQFAEEIELTPHAAIHNSIGGDGGDFSTHHSCNDPLFWLHHANIDRLWFDWQQKNAGVPQYDQSPQQPLPAFIVPIQQVLRTDDLCYTYESSSSASPSSGPNAAQYNHGQAPAQRLSGAYSPYMSSRANAYQRSALTKIGYSMHSEHKKPEYKPKPAIQKYATNEAPKPVFQPTTAYPSSHIPESYVEKLIEDSCKNCPKYNDRSDQAKLRPTFVIPTKWLKLNGFNEERFRQDELNNAKFISELNSRPGYVSKACLGVRFGNSTGNPLKPYGPSAQNITQAPTENYRPSQSYGPEMNNGNSLAYGPAMFQTLQGSSESHH